MNEILEAESVTFSWPASKLVFDRLSLKFRPGSLTAILGRNGAGKTTFVKLLCGLLHPHSGEVKLVSEAGKTNVSRRMPATLKDLFFVSENTELPDLTVSAFGCVAGALYPHFDAVAFHDNLRHLDISEGDRISALSFGQKRKTHIAFALATNAKVLFLDEPSNGLDIAAQIALRKLLIASVTEERTIVLSTHHVREFEQIFDRVVVLDKGTILADQTLEDLQSSGDFFDLETWYVNLVGDGGRSDDKL